MPEFLSRPLEWFRARPRSQQALIGAGVLVVLAAASQAVAVIAVLVFFVAAAAFLVQLVRRRPVRGWVFVALGSLAVAVVFFALAGAIYGPAEEQANEPAPEEEPVVEEEPPRDQEQEPAQEQAQEVPEYSFEHENFRELGNGTIVIELSLQTEATDEEDFRAIGQELKEEFRGEVDALFVEAPEVQMWVLIEERAEETYREGVVETPEYRNGVAVYPRELLLPY